RILLEELAIVPVNACNKEVISLTGAVLDSSNDGGTVSVANLMRDDAYGESPLLAQRPRKKIRPVIQLPCRRNNPLASNFGNMLGRRCIVQNCGNRARREPQVRCHRFQC